MWIRTPTEIDRRTLFGHPFDGPTLGHEAGIAIHFHLHAWVYTNNPNDELGAWNSHITCPTS